MDFTGREEENSLVEKLKEYPNLMILKAFTKMYAMAGVRLGFGLTEDTELIDRMYHGMCQFWQVQQAKQPSKRMILSKKLCSISEKKKNICIRPWIH